MAAKRRVTSVNHDEPSPRGKKLDPIIEGLFARLPSSGTEWPKTERKNWLSLIEQAFNVIYEDEEASESHIVTP